MILDLVMDQRRERKKMFSLHSKISLSILFLNILFIFKRENKWRGEAKRKKEKQAPR